MTRSHKAGLTAAVALTLLAFSTPMALAGDWSNSAQYNGWAAQNQPSNYSMRDANGNLTLVNGQVTSSIYQQGSGAQYVGGGAQYAGGGVGMNGAGATYGQANAIGNNLSVVVLGNHNTTIIDSTQTNNGNQSASVVLNSGQ